MFLFSDKHPEKGWKFNSSTFPVLPAAQRLGLCFVLWFAVTKIGQTNEIMSQKHQESETGAHCRQSERVKSRVWCSTGCQRSVFWVLPFKLLLMVAFSKIQVFPPKQNLLILTNPAEQLSSFFFFLPCEKCGWNSAGRVSLPPAVLLEKSASHSKRASLNWN